MKTISFVLYGMLSIVLLQACVQETVDIPDETTGLAPVYHEGDWRAIEMQDPQPIGTLFKIYYIDSLLFVGEAQKGIHIIDNSDPLNPQPIHFLQIIGNSDIAIKGNILYANNLSDLVSIDISDFNDIKVLSRVEEVFPVGAGSVPENYVGFFECPDPNMGPIIGWVETVLESPQCWN
jgi:hypothetical protein